MPGLGRVAARAGRVAVSLGPLALLLAGLVAAGEQSPRTNAVSEDWASSPEAYFLTAEERAGWRKLDSRDSRHDFIERYWLKRDPTPGTARNEFREMVLSRIKTADAQFKIEKTPGSATARGLVFIVLGSPARVQNRNAPRPPPETGPFRPLGALATPVASNEGNETTSTWFYEPDRTPRILEVIRRSSLQIKIVVEPSRHMDSIQEPGLFDEVREVVARASIVNPDLVPPSDRPEESAAAPPLPRQQLAAGVRQMLGEAPATSRRDGSFVGSAVIFREAGEAETLLWVYTPSPSGKVRFEALVRGTDGREVASISEPAAVSSDFSTRAPGMVALKRLPLPAGSYSAAVAITGEGGKPLAAAALPLQVPSLEKDFAVSSLIITRGPTASAPANELFSFAGTSLPPRADAAFTRSESLWYFVEVANPSDPAKVLIEPRLRRGGEPLAGLPPFPARLQSLGPGRYLAGVELPLATLSPGDYVIYLTVQDGEGQDRPRVLRRADFQITG
jgi:GWxTD domain-containing protein